jgi:hypothetical protein
MNDNISEQMAQAHEELDVTKTDLNRTAPVEGKEFVQVAEDVGKEVLEAQGQ